jgi:hypothetical protein
VSDIWAALGIAPTADAAAIRKAYADKLRGIDQDREQAAFMALRQAFTQALRLARPVAAAEIGPAEVYDAPRPPPDAAQLRDESRIAGLWSAFAAAEAQGAAGPAHRIYQNLLALGAGAPQGGISPLTLRMALIAAKDTAMPMPAADAMLQHLGLDAMMLERHKNLPGIVELTALCNRRLAADLWLRGLEAQAAQNSWGRRGRRHAVQVARFMLGRRRGIFGLNAGLLRRELDKFEQHRPFVAATLNTDRLDEARKLAPRWIYRHSERIISWLVVVALALAAVVRGILTAGPS